MIKMVIFDYGRTLYDREGDRLFPDAVSVIQQLSRCYRLAIVSYAYPEEEEERLLTLREHGILACFEGIYFTPEAEGKSQKYQELLEQRALQAHEVAVVDDHVIRGVAWGNRVGATTIWFQNGKFAQVLPDDQTGQPSFIIHSLSELIGILT